MNGFILRLFSFGDENLNSTLAQMREREPLPVFLSNPLSTLMGGFFQYICCRICRKTLELENKQVKTNIVWQQSPVLEGWGKKKKIHLWQFWRVQAFKLFELQCPVLHPVLVDVEIVEDFRAAGGGAWQQSLFRISHQPLVSVGGHFRHHVLLGPGVQPGLEAAMQTSVHPLVGLKPHK